MSCPIDAPVDVRQAFADAERDGYDAAWVSETKHDPLLQLALAATSTTDIRIGTAITLAFARNPMSLAVTANDLQSFSGGRLMLGLGSQVKAHITRRFSMPWSHPAPRMREYILALRAIWACWHDGTALAFEGEYYSHTLMTPFFDPGPSAHGAPAVILAGVGELMTETAGEVADGFLCHGFTTEKYLRETTLPALQRGRATAGRSMDGFDICGTPLLVTGRDEAEMELARRGVRGQLAFYGSTPAYRGVLTAHGWGDLGEELHRLSRSGGWDHMWELVDDEVVEAFAVVGEPDQVGAEIVRRYGDVMTRVTLYTPYEIAPEVELLVADGIRRAATGAGTP